MAKVKLTRCEIRWDKRGSYWFYQERIGRTWERRGLSRSPLNEDTPAMTKMQFIRAIVASLNRRVKGRAYGFSLRILNKSNEYGPERTYPRSADPKRSKG